MSGIVAIDLFAGAGGLTLGTEMAGVPIVLSVDNDGPSCAALSANHGFHSGTVMHADVVGLGGDALRSAAGIGSKAPLIVVGGPPASPSPRPPIGSIAVKRLHTDAPGHVANRRRSPQRAPPPGPIPGDPWSASSSAS